MKSRLAVFVLMGILWIGAPWAEETRTQRVRFADGATSTSVEGTITGYESVDYVLGAAAGQTMAVAMERDNTFLFFNVLWADTEEALFVGSAEAEPDSWSGALPNDGDYIVRVYLMRNEARRGKAGHYSMVFSFEDPED